MNSFTFYKSFYDAINCLGEKSQLKLYKSIMKLSFNQCENVTELEQLCNEIETELEQNRSVFAQFLLIKPHLLKSAKASLNGVLGGAPHKNLNAKKTSEKQANIKDKDKSIKIKFKEEVEEEKTTSPTPPDNFVSDLSVWYGEYSNVHLTSRQYDLLLQEVLSRDKLAEIIEELSENIACANGKAPPYDETNPDMHFALLRKYWRYRKNNSGSKPHSQEDKAFEFKKKMEELADKYRLEEALKSG